MKERFELYGGVNNPTDEKPDFASITYPDEPLGRFLFVGAKVQLGRIF